MAEIISLRDKAVEKRYKELFQNGSAAYELKEDNTYIYTKTNKNNINAEQVKKDMTKGYMQLLSKLS